MMNQMNITKEKSDDLAFANTCLTSSAITFDEFKKWIYWIIETADDYPSYIFDIVDIKEKFGYTLKVRNIVGFIPSWDPSDEERIAIAGIAYSRFPDHKTDLAPRALALSALENNPHIGARFRNTFPFIAW